jgi:hypothetical protein
MSALDHGEKRTPASTHLMHVLLLICFLSGAAMVLLAADCVSLSDKLAIPAKEGFAPALAGASALLLWMFTVGFCLRQRIAVPCLVAVLCAIVLAVVAAAACLPSQLSRKVNRRSLVSPRLLEAIKTLWPNTAQ